MALRGVLTVACVAASLAQANAWELAGRKTLSAVTGDGREIALGAVEFIPEGSGAHAVVQIDKSKLEDHFLSMREFKCLDGKSELVCYVPYPYKNPGAVSATDFAWLEHALLFLTKKPSEVGADLWNGLYFHMTLTENGLVGEPRAVDLNQIASPPDDPSKPPFGVADLGDVQPGAHYFSKLLIR